MTPDEVCLYLGFPEGTKVIPEVTDGMKDVPYPHTDAAHVTAFSAFLRCVGKPPRRIIESQAIQE